MKNGIIKALAFIGLSLSLCSATCGNETDATINEGATDHEVAQQSTMDICALTKNETQLNFGTGINANNWYMYLKSELEEGKNNFDTHFYWQQLNHPFATHEVAVKAIDFFSLIDTLKTMGYNPESSKQHFAGLRMYYGIETENMVMIFEPLLMIKRTGEDSCDVTHSNKYFKADPSGSLIKIDNAVFTTLTQAYKDMVYIVRTDKTLGDSFIAADNFKDGDMVSCSMPMQELVRMFRDNLPSTINCHNVPVEAEKITFTIIANKYAYYNKDTKLIPEYKLHVIAHYKIGENGYYANSFQNLGADFGQMDPPHKFTVPLPPALQ